MEAAEAETPVDESDEGAKVRRGVKTALVAFFLSAVVGFVFFAGTATTILAHFKHQAEVAEQEAHEAHERERRRRICENLGITETELVRREANGEKLEDPGESGR